MRVWIIALVFICLAPALSGTTRATLRIDINPTPAVTGQPSQVEFVNTLISRATVTVTIRPAAGATISRIAGAGVACTPTPTETTCQLGYHQRLVVAYTVVGPPCKLTSLVDYELEAGEERVRRLLTAVPGHCQYLPELFYAR